MEEAKTSGAITLPTGIQVEHIPINQIKQKIPTCEIDNRFWFLIAFEILSLFAGEKILDEKFDVIRAYLCKETETCPVGIQKLQAEKYEAIHGIIFNPEDNYIDIEIRLFRWISVIVTFPNVRYRGDGLLFLNDIKTKKCQVAFHKNKKPISKWVYL